MGDHRRLEAEGPALLEPVINVPSWGRDNYKKWPWASFLSVAVCIGIIFLIAGSPQTVWQAKGSHFLLSLGFLTVGSALLLPSIIAIIVLIWIWISKATGCCLPLRIRRFILFMNGKSPRTDRKETEKDDGKNSSSEITNKRSSKVMSKANMEKSTSTSRFTYTNPAMEPYMGGEDDEYDVSEELVLNVTADNGRLQEELPPMCSGGSCGSYRREGPETAVRELSLEGVKVWIVPPSMDMATNNGARRTKTQQLPQVKSHSLSSKSARHRTMDTPFASTNVALVHSDDVTPEASVPQRCKTSNTKRKQKATPTLLSLSESYTAQAHSSPGPHRQYLHVTNAGSRKAY